MLVLISAVRGGPVKIHILLQSLYWQIFLQNAPVIILLKISEKLIHISIPHDMEIILDKKILKIGIINFGTLWTIFRILEQCEMSIQEANS